MKIALIGASGMIGQRILREAVDRGHDVTAIARDPSQINASSPRVTTSAGDATDAEQVARLVNGHGAVVSAVGPSRGPHTSADVLVRVARALVVGLQRAGVRRLLWVGGAGSLEVDGGIQLMETPEFPEALRAEAGAQRATLDVLRTEGSAAGIEWTYLSPPADIAPGQRTGQYRVGGDHLLTNFDGRSHITAEDYAVAVLDELERPANKGRRFTVAY